MNKINHIGFILDGNRRWAKLQNKPTIYGHEIGAKNIKNILELCIKNNIKSISMYCFSTENWNRSEFEVNYLMNLIKTKLKSKKILNFLMEKNIRFIWNGIEDKLDNSIISLLHSLEQKTINNYYNFQFLFNYGSNPKLIKIINNLIGSNKLIDQNDLFHYLDPYNLGMVDLIIRTSNTKRLSNFLLNESAYAELIFSNKYWPEYDENEFNKNLNEYHQIKRNFGGS